MKNKNVEVIEIDLGINIDDEIRQKVDSLNSDITLYTKKLVDRAAEKQKTTNKKKLAQQKRSKQADQAIDILRKAYDQEDKWFKGWELVQAVGMEITPQNVNKLSMLVKKKLAESSEFAMLKKRVKGKMRYRLGRLE